MLTVTAVFSLPALQAVAVPVVVAGEVSPGVVTGSAVSGALFAVVVLIAHDVVGVTQLALVGGVDVLGPLVPDRQFAAGGQTADEVVLVLCMNEQRGGERLTTCV